jgi:hypothetical protein
MVEEYKRKGGQLISDMKRSEENLKAEDESSEDDEDEDEEATYTDAGSNAGGKAESEEGECSKDNINMK